MPAQVSRPVMVVDDNADIRDAMAEMFKLGGYEVVCAENGRVALDQLEAGVRPCLILLDMDMPVMGAMGFREAQLEREDLVDIPIAIYSANHSFDPRMRSLGVNDFFPKPVDFARLFNLVALHCCEED